MNVVKRDGQTQEFDRDKIYQAVMKAAISNGIDDFNDIADSISEEVQSLIQQASYNYVAVEEIQDLVEIALHNYGNVPEITKSYILFREKRRLEREKNSRFSNIIKSRALAPEDANQRNNANMDEYSFGGRMQEANESLWKEIALSDFMPQDIAELHRKGWLYQHDLSRWALGQSNCLNMSLRYPFEHGFKLRNSELRPPSRFATAAQLTAVIMQIASQSQYGGIAIAALDRDLAPFAEKSYKKIAEKFANNPEYIQREYEAELAQGAEALVHNLSSLQSRPGAQLPFSSVNFGTDTSRWGQDVSRALLKAMISGVGIHHLTPTFPIMCFQIKDGINKKPEDPNYDLKLLAIECSTKRLTPNFVNLDSSVCHSNPENPDTWLTAMGCRTQLGFDRFDPVNPYNRVGRGNLAPATINLVPLAIEANGDPNVFIKSLEYMLKKAEEALLIRAHLMFNQKQKAAYEYYVNHLWSADYEYDPEASVYEILRHGTLAIGCVGIANAMTALFGKHQGEDLGVEKFVEEEIAVRFNKFAAEASQRNNLNFSAYATPAESLVHTIMKLMKEQYGVIPGVTDTEYLTNSYHIPVSYECDVLEKIEKESHFAKYFTGGNIVYFELDSTAVNNIKGVEALIDFAFFNDIPYLAFNFPLDECPKCGYSGEILGDCPECGCPDEELNRLRRVTGYITASYKRAFNPGKRQETEDRIKHSLNNEVAINAGS